MVGTWRLITTAPPESGSSRVKEAAAAPDGRHTYVHIWAHASRRKNTSRVCEDIVKPPWFQHFPDVKVIS